MSSSQTKAKSKINKSALKNLLGIYRFILPYKTYFVLGLICLFFSNLTLLAFPYVTGKLVDTSIGKFTFGFDNINDVAIMLFIILTLQSILAFFRIFFFAKVSENSIADMRRYLYEKYLYLPLQFYDKNRIGELMSRITSDITILQGVFSLNLAEFIRQLIILSAGIILIFITTPSLALFMLSTFPVIIIVGMILGNFIKRVAKKRQKELAEANIIVEETLQSISTVKSFTNEHLESKKYGEKLKAVIKAALKTAGYRGLFTSFIIFAIFGGIILVLWYGSKLVQENALTIGELTSFLIYMMFIGGSVAGLGDLYGILQKAIGASERILDIFHQPDEKEKISPTKSKVINHIENITFQRVHFSYPTRLDAHVIKGIDINIEGGQKIALVGHSGSGKSTLVQLLLRFYQPNEGIISLNNYPINNYKLNNYRNQIGYVSQEILLFGGTIRENILYGNPKATEDALWQAIEQANAAEFIKGFPQRLETIVGERGIKLSGGQKQRVAIARTILKNPKILILDEATSSLDAQSEQYIQEALQYLTKNKTTIIIAHRLSTIRQVDKIYVVNKGIIAEEGTHESLLKKKGIYHNLVKIQLEA